MLYVFVIKDIRQQKGISLFQLSKKADISLAYLNELELNKKNNPSLTTLYKIAKALDVNVKELFYTNYDINYLKNELDKQINIFGLQSTQVAQISKVIDLISSFELRENRNKIKNLTYKTPDYY